MPTDPFAVLMFERFERGIFTAMQKMRLLGLKLSEKPSVTRGYAPDRRGIVDRSV